MDKRITEIDDMEILPARLLNAQEVAVILGVSKPKAYQIMQRRELPVVVMGRSIRVKPSDLEEFIESNTDRGANGKETWK